MAEEQDRLREDAWEWTHHCPGCGQLVGACACVPEGPEIEHPTTEVV